MKSRIVAQFRRPSGMLGGLAGRIMASRRSNIIRNERTVDLLELSADARVLEIGCGPGLALAACARAVVSGRIVGLDHSDVMIRQARKRLQGMGAIDRVELVAGGLERLAGWSEDFDRVFSLNVVQFVDDRTAFYRRVHKVLAPGGRCFTTYQPRLDRDGAATSRRMIEGIEHALGVAEFGDITSIEIIGGQTPAICVVATKP